MNPLFLKAALTVALLFGSMGGTAALAANSLPDSPLYQVKLQIENARLALADDAPAQAVLHLAFAAARGRELADLSLGGEPPDQATLERLEYHLQYALQLAAQSDNDAMDQLLRRIREMAQTQEGLLLQAGPGPLLEQARQMWQQAGDDAAAGLQEPQTFRWQHGHGPADRPLQNGPCQTEDCLTPDAPFRQGPQPVPGAGPCDNPDGCDPAGAENQYRHGQDEPVIPGQYGPGPADGAGDGTCENLDGCDPAGAANQFQHGQDEPVVPGGYGPGPADGDCDNPDGCDPAGAANQHQHGQDEPVVPGGYGPGPDGAENQNQNGQEDSGGTPSRP